MRVAATVEQFWHRVPGGTATAAARTLAPLADGLCPDLDLVGVAAAHRRPPAPEFRIGLPVRHLPLPRPLLYDAWRVAHAPPVQLVTGRVDLVHATTIAIPPAPPLKPPVPLVVTLHDLAFLHAPEHFTRRGNRMFRWGLDVIRQRADAVLVPSRQTWDECARAGIEESRLRLVPLGVHPDVTTPDGVAAALRRFGLTRPYVLWCGTQEPRKNLAGLLDGFARFCDGDTELDLVLVGPPGWGDALGSGRRPPEHRIHTLGFVEPDDLTALYRGARAFVYPSLREGFGLPVLEAMAHGVPVVTTMGTPMADLVGGAGVCVDPTPQEIADGLVEITGPAHDRYAAQAVPRSREFSWDAAARATAGVYQDVLGG